MRFLRHVLLATFAVVLAFSQTDSGTVSGFVSDPSGAAVAAAAVTLRNPATGATYRAQSSETGNYVIAAVVPGTYELAVEAAGFARSVRTNLAVNVQARLQADFVLRLGDVAETVEVSATTPLLESQNTSVGQVVENKVIVTLPLNGRNYSQLATLMPGATPNVGSRAADGFTLNGHRTFQNVYLVDGLDNNNYILGTDTNSAQAIRPSIDAIQEFKVESANYGAEFGRAAGGVISVAIKSGTNRFSGSAFEFVRNDKFDANNFFSNRAGLERPPLRRNQFGGTFGGPIVKDRTFFFTSYQATIERSASTTVTTVPQPAMVGGDFGTVNVFDPSTFASGQRQQFANNRIPVSRFDPVAQRLAALYVAPNQPGLVNNFTSNVSRTDDDHQFDTRVDHRFSDKDSVFARGSINRREISRGSVFAAPGNGGSGFDQFPLRQLPEAWSLVGNYTRLVSSAAVNEFRLGFSRNESDQVSPAERSLYDDFGIRGVPAREGLTGLPTFTVAGFSALGDRTFAPNPKRTGVLQMVDNVSWVKGNHTLKFGGDYRRTGNFAATSSSARGTFGFNGQFTARVPGQGIGSGMADLLLGLTNTATLTSLLFGDLRNDYYGVFVQDTWKVTRKLTLNYGLRYELQTPMWEKENLQGNFDLNPASPTFGSIAPATGDSILSRTFSKLDRNNFAPRLGFAYQASDSTVIRVATGIFYGGLGWQAIGNMAPNNPPYFIGVTFPTANTANTSQLVLASGFPSDTLDPARVRNPNGVAVLERFPMSTVYQWNASVQQQLPGQMAVTVSYVGSGSNYLGGFSQANDPLPGPGAINPRRPFPTFGGITLNSAFAHSTYHSLQSKLERRFSQGFSILSSYTWSHGIDNSVNGEDTGNGPVQPQNPYNIAAEKGPSGTDVRHRSVTSAIWDVPMGRDNGFLGGNPVARAILGGWQLAGIFTAQTGLPFSPTLAPNPANTTGPARPDRLRDGNLSGSERNIDRWFDVGAFAPAAPFTFGNSGRNVLRGPSLTSLDGMVSRNFRMGEQRNLEFRWEMFNLSNSAQFARPNNNISVPQAARITATQIPARQMQFGLRFTF